MPDKQIIQADGLSKYYGDRIALKNATFTISQGECVGFLGRNGTRWRKKFTSRAATCFRASSLSTA